VRDKMAGFRRDPGTVKVDYALRGPVPWRTPPPQAPGTVHISESYEELVITFAQLSTGSIPERPFLLVGQWGNRGARPAIDLPADSRTGPGYHADPRALLGVRLGTPRQ
jgi:hypothetical protein